MAKALRKHLRAGHKGGIVVPDWETEAKENLQLEASLNYVVRPCLKTTKKCGGGLSRGSV